MSLFDTAELRSLLSDTKAELRADGADEATAERLTRREFVMWLEGYTSELKLTIAANITLPPDKRDERLKRQRNDFHFFRTTYFPHYYYLPGRSELQEHLESIYRRIASKATHTAPKAGSGEKFAEAAPRGHGKSTDVSVVFILWVIVNRLKHFPTLFSDAIELTETLIESIKAELEENENLKADFPSATGTGRIWKIGDIVTRNGIRVKGYGSGKRVRGVKHGVWRPDLVIIDDLENDENVQSRPQRDKLEKWLDDAVDNLGSVEDTMDIIYIGTILHRDSVLARKLKLAFWNPKIFRAVMRFPLRMDLWEEYNNIYRIQGAEAAHDWYEANRPEMDEGSRVLWPEAVPIETLMRKRARNQRSFNKEQQNNPNAENQDFKRDRMHFYKELPLRLQFFGWCDPAGKKKKSDFTNITIIGIYRKQRKAYVAISFNKVMAPKTTIKEILAFHKAFNCKKWGVESNFGQDTLVDWIKDTAFDAGVQIDIRGYHSSQNKEECIESLVLPIEDGDILLHESQVMLIEQLEDFPEGTHDDAPDGLFHCYKLAKMKKKRKRDTSGQSRAPRPKHPSQYGRLP